jgi:phage protein D
VSPLLQTPGLYSARPAVAVGGRDSAPLTDGLLAALVEETTDGLYRCELTVGNWGVADGDIGFLLPNRRSLDFGASITVRMGAGDGAAEVFAGRVSAMEGRFPVDRAPEIALLAEDRLQDLRMSRRTRTFEDLDAAAIVRQVASGHGLQADVDLDGPRHPVVAQVNQSDLAFLRDLLARVDAEVWVEGATLRAAPRTRRPGGPVKIAYGRELRELSVLADLAGQRTAIAVGGWDVAAKEGIDSEATEAAVQPELDGGESGPATLERAFGERKDRLVHAVPLTTAEATALAEAAMRRAARRFVTAAGLTEGDGRIRVGATLEVTGVGEAYSGRYRVTRARHEFSAARGYLTHFELARPSLGTT